jgi:hypothetical protein
LRAQFIDQLVAALRRGLLERHITLAPEIDLLDSKPTHRPKRCLSIGPVPLTTKTLALKRSEPGFWPDSLCCINQACNRT